MKPSESKPTDIESSYKSQLAIGSLIIFIYWYSYCSSVYLYGSIIILLNEIIYDIYDQDEFYINVEIFWLVVCISYSHFFDDLHKKFTKKKYNENYIFWSFMKYYNQKSLLFCNLIYIIGAQFIYINWKIFKIYI